MPRLTSRPIPSTSAPGDFNSLELDLPACTLPTLTGTVRLNGGHYRLVGAGYHNRNGRKWYYQTIRNSDGEFVDVGSDELKRIVNKTA